MEEFEFLGIETKPEIEELFHAVTQNVKYEETDIVDTKPAVLPEDYKFQRPDGGGGTEYSTVMTRSITNTPLPLLCRLCAIPGNNTTDIFCSDATGQNIQAMINLCLPIMVKEMNTLPRRVCQSCLVELERCYRFHRTVAEAEKKILTLGGLASGDFEEMKSNSETFPRCGSEDESIARDNVDETTGDTTAKRNVLLSCLRPCSVVLSIADIPWKNNCEANSRMKSSSDSERQNSDSKTGVLDAETTSASGIVSQSTCDSGATTEIRSRSVANTALEKKAKHSSENEVDPAIHKRSRIQEGRYGCSRCPKMFTFKYNLTKHYKLHTGRGLYICDCCGKKFVSEKDRIRHHRIHTGERPFECLICGRKFVVLSTLKRHRATVHSGRRDYPCSMCQKSFKTASDRNTHLSVVHTDGKWQCDHCQKSSKRKPGLLKHIRICKKRHRSEHLTVIG